MLQRFVDNVTCQHLFPTGQEVLAAVSGGVDSVVLTHLMHLAGYPFAIAHCNFGLRPGDCDRDEVFVRQLADGYGVPCHVVRFDTATYATEHHEGTEEAARHLRYRWFADLCRQHGYPAVLVAHHADDAAETLLLNLLRGTGLAGLHGILPTTVLQPSPDGSGSCPDGPAPLTVVRPLLPFSRSDIERYALSQGLSHVEDVTNSSLCYRRNRVRHQLLPLLEEIHAGATGNILSTARRLRRVEQLYDYLLQPLRQRYMDIPGTLSLRQLKADVPEELHCQLLFEMLRPYGFNGTQVRNILTVNTSGHVVSSATHQALCHNGDLLITPVAAASQPAPCARLTVTPVPVPDPARLPADARPMTIHLDADTFRQPLRLRPWQAGDRLQPLGMAHGSKLVSDILADCKVPLTEKSGQLLLVDADDQILWVVGLRIAHKCRITANTCNAVEINVFTQLP